MAAAPLVHAPPPALRQHNRQHTHQFRVADHMPATQTGYVLLHPFKQEMDKACAAQTRLKVVRSGAGPSRNLMVLD